MKIIFPRDITPYLIKIQLSQEDMINRIKKICQILKKISFLTIKDVLWNKSTISKMNNLRNVCLIQFSHSRSMMRITNN